MNYKSTDKKPLRQMLIDEFKKAGARPVKYEPVKKQVVSNVKAGKPGVLKKSKEVPIKIKLNPLGAYRTTPITSLAEQYINARKNNDDDLADYIFLQISHLD